MEEGRETEVPQMGQDGAVFKAVRAVLTEKGTLEQA